MHQITWVNPSQGLRIRLGRARMWAGAAAYRIGLGARTKMAAETERAGVKGLGPWIDKYHERVTLIIAILAFVISVYSLFDGRYTDQMNRSTEEVQRLYSTDFSDGLSELLVHSHEFIGHEGSSRLRTKQRYHEFWQDYGDDSGMLIVYSVLKSIVASAV